MLARVRIVCFAYSSCGFHVTYVGLYQTPRLETGLASTPGMNPWLILIVDKPLVCQRGLPGRLQIKDLRTATGTGMHFYPQFAIVDPHRTQSVLVALVAHWAYFGLFRAQRAAFVRPAKNARNDVHAVISDLSLVLPILCQCSE